MADKRKRARSARIVVDAIEGKEDVRGVGAKVFQELFRIPLPSRIQHEPASPIRRRVMRRSKTEADSFLLRLGLQSEYDLLQECARAPPQSLGAYTLDVHTVFLDREHVTFSTCALTCARKVGQRGVCERGRRRRKQR